MIELAQKFRLYLPLKQLGPLRMQNVGEIFIGFHFVLKT